MPFGLDGKSVLIGAVLGAFVVPRIIGAVAARKSQASK